MNIWGNAVNSIAEFTVSKDAVYSAEAVTAVCRNIIPENPTHTHTQTHSVAASLTV